MLKNVIAIFQSKQLKNNRHGKNWHMFHWVSSIDNFRTESINYSLKTNSNDTIFGSTIVIRLAHLVSHSKFSAFRQYSLKWCAVCRKFISTAAQRIAASRHEVHEVHEVHRPNALNNECKIELRDVIINVHVHNSNNNILSFWCFGIRRTDSTRVRGLRHAKSTSTVTTTTRTTRTTTSNNYVRKSLIE